MAKTDTAKIQLDEYSRYNANTKLANLMLMADLIMGNDKEIRYMLNEMITSTIKPCEGVNKREG